MEARGRFKTGITRMIALRKDLKKERTGLAERAAIVKMRIQMDKNAVNTVGIDKTEKMVTMIKGLKRIEVTSYLRKKKI